MAEVAAIIWLAAFIHGVLRRKSAALTLLGQGV
jgi:hypothetical protein